MGNFFKFSETRYDCEVTSQIWRFKVVPFLFKYKNGKKGLSIPNQFDIKAVNLAEKNHRKPFYAPFLIEMMTQFLNDID